MTKSNQLKLINLIYSRLDFLNNYTWTAYRDDLFNQCLKSEKQHRKGRPDGVTCGISARDAAKYFTIKYIVETVVTGETFQVKDFITVRREWFYGQSIALNYRDAILENLKGIDLEQFLNDVDYCELMK